MRKKTHCLILIATLITIDVKAQWDSLPSTIISDMVRAAYFPDTVIGYIGGDDGIIYKTVDGGINWTAQTTPTVYVFTSICFSSNDTGFAVDTYGNVYKTTDGVNWNIPFTSSNALFSIFFINPSTGYSVGGSGNIIKTIDSGSTWTTQTTGSLQTFISVYFTNVNVGFAVGLNGTMYKTSDGGLNWNNQPSGTTEDLLCVLFTSDSIGYIAGGNGVILKTIDGGITWNPQTSGTSNGLWSIFFINDSTGYIAGVVGTILKTSDGGLNWHSQISTTTSPLFSIYFPDDNTGYAVGGYSSMAGHHSLILKTSNGGINSIGENILNDEISVYPNPTNGNFIIALERSIIRGNIEISNILGENIFIENIFNESRKEINLKNISSGIYFVKVFDGEKSYCKKLIVEHD